MISHFLLSISLNMESSFLAFHENDSKTGKDSFSPREFLLCVSTAALRLDLSLWIFVFISLALHLRLLISGMILLREAYQRHSKFDHDIWSRGNHGLTSMHHVYKNMILALVLGCCLFHFFPELSAGWTLES